MLPAADLALPPSARPYLRTLTEMEVEMACTLKPDLIEGLWVPSITVLAGQPYVGKTWLALHMAKATLTEQPFLGRLSHGRDRRIAYAGTDAWASREATTRARQLEIPEDRFLIHDRELPAPGTPVGWSAEIAVWRSCGIDTVILDNLLGLLPAGADVKDNHAVAPVLRQCTAMTKAGIAVLLLHHASKPGGPVGGGGKTPMGSQYIQAAARSTLMLSTPARGRADHKSLEVENNAGPALTLQLRLLAGAPCELLDAEPSSSRNRSDETWDALVADAEALLGAPASARANQSAAGRWLAEEGRVKDKEAGRNRIRRLLHDKGLLSPGSDGRAVVAGPRLPGQTPA